MAQGICHVPREHHGTHLSIVPTETGGPPDSPVRIAFSTLAFPDATLASVVSLGRRWGYAGVELRLADGELIDPWMPAGDRARVKQTVMAVGLPVVAVDSSIRLTGEDPGPELRRFLELASEVPVREMLGLLAAGGYRGWISVEWEKRWHPEIAEPEVALPQHLSVLAEWMEVKP
jgi:sugar phosphate isomerase/epimerase